MAVKNFDDITPILSSIHDGDKLLGERVDGTTVRISFNGVLLDSEFITNGLMVRAGADSWSNVTVTGVSNRTTVTNGDGTAGNPTVDISATYVGQSSITTLGTIGTGVWNGSLIDMAHSGSGANLTPSNGGVIYSTGTTMAVLSGTATANKLLLSGSSTTPSWSTSTIPTSAGATSGKYLKSDGTNYVLSATTIPDTATIGKLFRGNGTNYVETTSTFADTYSASVLLYSNGANTVTGLATANSGLLVTSGTGVPSISTDIPTAVTVGGAYNYRAAGTDVAVIDGGTGLSTMTTAYAPVCAGTTATGNLQVASTGLSTSGWVLTSTGASSLPTFQAPTAGSGSLKAVQTFAASGTYTRTSGANSALVIVVGGGGGGGGVSTTAGATAAGGGGGGCSIKYIASVGSTETVTVGASVAGGNTSGTNGAGGNTSSFGAWCSATGGSAGTGQTAATGTDGVAGGVGSSGDLNFAGGDGGGGSGSTRGGGVGGSSYFGGTMARTGANVTGADGRAYGSGGQGAQSTGTGRAGGAGAAGVVYVFEYS